MAGDDAFPGSPGGPGGPCTPRGPCRPRGPSTDGPGSPGIPWKCIDENSLWTGPINCD